MKKCPYCAEEIQDEAIVCRYCGRELSSKPIPAQKIQVIKPMQSKARREGKKLAVYSFVTIILMLCCILEILPTGGTPPPVMENIAYALLILSGIGLFVGLIRWFLSE